MLGGHAAGGLSGKFVVGFSVGGEARGRLREGEERQRNGRLQGGLGPGVGVETGRLSILVSSVLETGQGSTYSLHLWVPMHVLSCSYHRACYDYTTLFT